MSDMPNYDDLWDTHCKLVEHCQKQDVEIERLRARVDQLQTEADAEVARLEKRIAELA